MLAHIVECSFEHLRGTYRDADRHFLCTPWPEGSNLRRLAMIPTSIIDYLQRNGVAFKRRTHAQAVSAHDLAASLHVSGYRVAKSVIVDADGQKWIAVLPAAETVDLPRLANLLKANTVQLVEETKFAPLFAGCETGAEPPFGGLYGIPVVVDSKLADKTPI